MNQLSILAHIEFDCLVITLNGTEYVKRYFVDTTSGYVIQLDGLG
jgi:hypothetical protein